VPIVIDDRVIVGGYQKPTWAFRVRRNGNQWTTEDLWENPEIWQFMTNGVMVGDTVFGLSSRNRGQYFLLDSKSGKTIWTGMPRQAENAAILRAGGVVFSLEDDAELMVGRVSGSQVQEVKRYILEAAPDPRRRAWTVGRVVDDGDSAARRRQPYEKIAG